ncbi:hypothetical protein N7448_009991 [Penicillium atrosanguineum]|uniref:BZIP domain-containing protein n=1 Tax=Penicillium atrosanguineum TaxID=1132637 RepID=A0A9W9GGL3_9EURO|nr:uncharacterized protein N7443_007207 [Penicillium atrosanguineum]KAJ5119322.1 hypothetical protein N7448_009991 [Penicillium atrosanguineum]KAJ5296314.1 hypothetical protein N7443_007207 [Penicillium atrosanguineum]KAJ5299083.1 hypothetical protein N7476_010640 [Penicillium atrosanguineum]
MKKAFTFLPGHRTDKQDSESGGSSSTLFRRREQLRKAQRTHRLRKDQYFKNLESEVLRLRANEVNLVNHVHRLRNQVDVLQNIVDKHEQFVLSEPLYRLAETGNVQADLTPAKTPTEGFKSPQNGVSLVGSKAGMDFEGIDSSMDLSTNTIYSDVTSSHNTTFHSPLSDSSNIQQPDQYLCALTTTSLAQPNEPKSKDPGQISSKKMTDMGMEFILELEKPCLSHLERHRDKPNGHALLASATLVQPHHHHCAQSTLSTQDSTQNPAIIFDKLLALSEELVLDDELSPTQAWYCIIQQSWANRLDLVILRELSVSLSKLIKCYGFGAVMRRDAFEAILSQTFSAIRLGVGIIDDLIDGNDQFTLA